MPYGGSSVTIVLYVVRVGHASYRRGCGNEFSCYYCFLSRFFLCFQGVGVGFIPKYVAISNVSFFSLRDLVGACTRCSCVTIFHYGCYLEGSILVPYRVFGFIFVWVASLEMGSPCVIADFFASSFGGDGVFEEYSVVVSSRDNATIYVQSSRASDVCFEFVGQGGSIVLRRCTTLPYRLGYLVGILFTFCRAVQCLVVFASIGRARRMSNYRRSCYKFYSFLFYCRSVLVDSRRVGVYVSAVRIASYVWYRDDKLS